jgi:hypothetical protein
LKIIGRLINISSCDAEEWIRMMMWRGMMRHTSVKQECFFSIINIVCLSIYFNFYMSYFVSMDVFSLDLL